MKELIFSIIVPMYNCEEYIEDCLNSVLRQSVDCYEVICINDGSTDNTLKKVAEIKVCNDKIKIFSQYNQGLSVARNTGISKAMGKYIVFLDSDDMLVDNALEVLLEWVSKEDLDVLCYNAMPVLYENERLKRMENKDAFHSRSKEYDGINTGIKLFTEMVLANDFNESAWLLMVNRAWLSSRKISFYPGILYEDSLFSVECYLKAERARHIGSSLYIYRVRENSIMTQKVSQKNLDSRIIVYSELKKLYNELNNKSDDLDMAFNKYLEYINVNTDRIRNKLSLKNNTNELEFLKSKFYQSCIEAEEIILYGAGNVGNLIYNCLKNKELADKVTCFAISNIAREKNMMEGLPIRNIDTVINENKNQLVIISAGENFHNEMLAKAQTVGFSNIVLVSTDLEVVLRG